MGRAPCCDKANVKKGPWSPEEDAKLKSYIEQHGTGGNWIALPQKIGLRRCGKSCRLRWLNYLRPNIKHGGFSEEEDKIICSLYISIGSRWSIIAAQLPGRTDNDIKNYWNTRLKKKLLGSKPRKNQRGRRGTGGGGGGGNGSAVNKHEAVKKNNYCAMDCYGSFDYNSSINQTITPCWPQFPTTPTMPIPYSNQQDQAINDATSFNDHTSIRKLLIKLGGRFSNDFGSHDNYQLILNSNEFSSSLSRNSSIAGESCGPFPSHHPNSNSTTGHERISVSDGVLFSSGTFTKISLDNHSTNKAASHRQLPQTQDYALGECNKSLMLQQQGSCSSSFPSELDEIMYSCPQRLDGLEFLFADGLLENRLGWGDAGSLVCPFTSTCGSVQQG